MDIYAGYELEKRRTEDERQDLWRAAARGTQLYAAHCTAACGGPAAGYRQLVHQRNHAGGLWPEQRHPPRYPDLHHSGRDEPDRQRRVQQSGAAVRHGRGHRHGPQGKRGGRPVRRSGLYHYEYSHSGHDQCGRRCRSNARQLHHHHAGHHDPANGCVRRYRGRSGRGGAAQQVL